MAGAEWKGIELDLPAPGTFPGLQLQRASSQPWADFPLGGRSSRGNDSGQIQGLGLRIAATEWTEIIASGT